jgi:hypothetical protein
MTLNRIGIVCILSLVGAAGCANDPGKNVNSAANTLSKEENKAHSDAQDQNAEATRKQETTHAESAGNTNSATSDAKKDLSVAHADLAQDRRDFSAKTKERLAKIDARAKELKVKSGKLTGKKAADFKMHHATFDTQRSDTTSAISSAEGSTNDGWSSAKTVVDKKLDELDAALEGMEKDL